MYLVSLRWLLEWMRSITSWPGIRYLLNVYEEKTEATVLMNTVLMAIKKCFDAKLSYDDKEPDDATIFDSPRTSRLLLFLKSLGIVT